MSEWQQLQDVLLNWAEQSRQESQTLAVRDMEKDNNIVFNINTGTAPQEMLRVSPEGFWVRGVKVEQDEREAEIVYNNLKQWLTWAQLNRD